jgi:hypothetical protein
VRVHDDDIAGLASYQDLVGMRGVGVGKYVLRKAAEMVATGDAAERAIFEGEVIEQPDGVAYPVAVFIGNRAHIGVERLQTVRVGIGRAGIETAEFEARLQDLADEMEDFRHHDHLFEDLAFVNEVGEAVGVLFLTELGAGVFAFAGVKLIDAAACFFQERGREETGEAGESFAFEVVVHGTILYDLGPIV